MEAVLERPVAQEEGFRRGRGHGHRYVARKTGGASCAVRLARVVAIGGVFRSTQVQSSMFTPGGLCLHLDHHHL